MRLEEFFATAQPDITTLLANQSVKLDGAQRLTVQKVVEAIDAQRKEQPIQSLADDSNIMVSRVRNLLSLLPNNHSGGADWGGHTLAVWQAVALVRLGEHLGIQQDFRTPLTEIIPQLADVQDVQEFDLTNKTNLRRPTGNDTLALSFEQFSFLHEEYGNMRAYMTGQGIRLPEVTDKIVSEGVISKSMMTRFRIADPENFPEFSTEKRDGGHFKLGAHLLKVLMRMAELAEYPGLENLRSTLDNWIVTATTESSMPPITPRSSALGRPIILPPGRYIIDVGGREIEIDSPEPVKIKSKPDPTIPTPGT